MERSIYGFDLYISVFFAADYSHLLIYGIVWNDLYDYVLHHLCAQGQKTGTQDKTTDQLLKWSWICQLKHVWELQIKCLLLHVSNCASAGVKSIKSAVWFPGSKLFLPLCLWFLFWITCWEKDMKSQIYESGMDCKPAHSVWVSGTFQSLLFLDFKVYG